MYELPVLFLCLFGFVILDRLQRWWMRFLLIRVCYSDNKIMCCLFFELIIEYEEKHSLLGLQGISLDCHRYAC